MKFKILFLLSFYNNTQLSCQLHHELVNLCGFKLPDLCLWIPKCLSRNIGSLQREVATKDESLFCGLLILFRAMFKPIGQHRLHEVQVENDEISKRFMARPDALHFLENWEDKKRSAHEYVASWIAEEGEGQGDPQVYLKEQKMFCVVALEAHRRTLLPVNKDKEDKEKTLLRSLPIISIISYLDRVLRACSASAGSNIDSFRDRGSACLW